jgi:hypothetical protein
MQHLLLEADQNLHAKEPQSAPYLSTSVAEVYRDLTAKFLTTECMIGYEV